MKYVYLFFLFFIFGYSSFGQSLRATPTVTGSVNKILKYNNNLFICGVISAVGTDTNARQIAMLNAQTGALQNWHPNPVGGSISSMIIQSGKLIVSGNFTQIAGQSRSGIAIFDAATGNLNAITPSGLQSANALFADNDTIYFVGQNAGGNPNVKKFDLNTGIISPWHSDDFIYWHAFFTLAKSGNYIYVGGQFNNVAGNWNAINLTRFDATTGAADNAFMQNKFIQPEWIQQILPYNNHIYICGSFSHYGSLNADGFITLDSTGAITTFDIGADNTQTLGMFAQGRYLWVGGNSVVWGGATTYYAAQIDINTGRATCWTNPDYNHPLVDAIYVQGDTVFLGDWANGFSMSVGNVYTGPLTMVVSVSDTTLCPGAVDTFRATVTNAARIINYQWYRNDWPVGNNSPVYIDTVLSGRDTIRVEAANNLCNISTVISPNIYTRAKSIAYKTLAQDICEGGSYLFHGQNLTAAGMYYDTLTGANGCDSILTLVLTIHNISTTHQSQTICPGNSYQFYGHNLTLAGTYYDTLTASSTGCDSVIILELMVGSINLTALSGICLGSDTLSISGASSATQIQWQLNGHTITNITPDTVYITGVTVAGTGVSGSGSDQLSIPKFVFVDDYSNIFVADAGNYRIQEFPAGSVAGSYGITVAGGNGNGNNANQLSNPTDVFVDNAGYIYVCDNNNNQVQRFPPGSNSNTNGVTIAGGNGPGNALNQLNSPVGIFVDNSRNLYVSDDYNHRILEFPWGSTSATNATIRATLYQPGRIFVDASNNIYCGGTGIIEYFPGSTDTSYGVDRTDGYHSTTGIWVDNSNNLYITDTYIDGIRKFPSGSNANSHGKVLAGNNGNGSGANQFNLPLGLYVDASANIYVADALNNRIQKWSPSLAPINTNYIPTAPGSYSAIVSFAGCSLISDTIIINPVVKTYLSHSTCSGDSFNFNGHMLTQAGIYHDTLQTVLSCDSILEMELFISPLQVTTVNKSICTGTSFLFDGRYLSISGTYVDTLPAIAGCDSVVTLILSVDSILTTSVTKHICNGDSIIWGAVVLRQSGFYTDTLTCVGGCDSVVTLHLITDSLSSISLISSGAPCTADTLSISGSLTSVINWNENSALIKIDTTIKIVAGQNGYGYGSGQIGYASGVFVDSSNNVFVTDGYANSVQKWTPGATTGVTVAGGNIIGGPAANQLWDPFSCNVDRNGNIYITDYYNNRIQMWAPGATYGITVAGDSSGIAGVSSNRLNGPTGIYLDNNGVMYIADFNNNRVQKWLPGASSGTTVAGDSAGSPGVAPNLLNGPEAVFVNTSGDVYVADMNNNRIQKWQMGSTSGTTVAGDSTGAAGSGANSFDHPESIYVDQAGSIYVGDWYNNRVQKWTNGATSGITVAGGTYGYELDQLEDPDGIWVDANGDIFVADGSNSRVLKYTQYRSFIPQSTGIYTASITNDAGCTAISNAIIIGNNYQKSQYDTICAGYSIHIGPHYYNRSGIYIDTIASITGCDSIIKLYLTVKTLYYSRIYDTLSPGHYLTVGLHSYSQTGIYSDTLISMTGCDSIITSYLLVFDSSLNVHRFDTICEGFSVSIAAHTYSISGTYIDTLRGTTGSDTILTLNLMVTPALVTNTYDTICQGSSVTTAGHTYSSSGIYIDTLFSVRSCDSIQILHLAVLPDIYPTLTISASRGIAVTGLQNDTFTAHCTDCRNPYFNWYLDTVLNNQHDSIIILPSLRSTDSIICRVDCNNLCPSISYAYSNEISTGTKDENMLISGVSIYPNPTAGGLTLKVITSSSLLRNAHLSLLNVIGQSIQTQDISLHIGNNIELININDDTPSGVYILQISTYGQIIYFRFVLDR